MVRNEVFWRWFLAATCVAVLILLTAYLGYRFCTTPPKIPKTSYDAYRQVALEMTREQISGFFQIGVLLLGALWATLVVKRDSRIRSTDIPEIVSFVASNIIIVGFLYFNSEYQRRLARFYWDMGPLLSPKKQFADVMNSTYVLVLYEATMLCFYGGLLLSALSVLSSRLSREGS